MRVARGFYGFGLLVAVFLLTACGSVLDSVPGGGGGGSGGGSVDTDGGGKTADEKKMGMLSGVAKDALVQNATVNVYAWNGSKGMLLSSGSTDDKGKYAFILQAKSQAVLLEVVGGTYSEEATGTSVRFGNQDALYAVQNYVAGKPLITAITYYTTLATGLAENLVRLGMDPDAAVEAANTRVGNVIGVDIRRVMPTDIVAPDDVTRAPLEYGFATAALSSLTERASVMNGVAPHSAAFTSIRFIQAAYDDVRADGVLNGRGLNGDVMFGNIRLNSEIYRHELALHILRIANNQAANKTGVGPTQIFDFAQRLNTSSDGIFGGDPVIAIDRDKPNVSPLVAAEFPNLASGSVVFGSFNLSAMVVAFPGAVSAEFLLDGQTLVTAADPQNPTLSLDTLNPRLAEGEHTLQLRVTDLSRAVGESPLLTVTVANQQASIANVDIEGKFVGSSTSVLATVMDSARPVRAVYSVRAAGSPVFLQVATPDVEQGKTLVPLSAMFDPAERIAGSTDFRFAEGDATFRIEVTNSVGVTVAKDVPFIIDRTGPLVSIDPIAIDPDSPQGRYFDASNAPCTPAQPPVASDPCMLFARRNFDVTATGSDNRALASVAATVATKPVGQPVMLDGIVLSSPISVTIDPSNFVADDGTKDGPRAIAVTAIDKAQNMFTDMRRVFFDTTLPKLTSPVRVTPVAERGGVAMTFGDRLAVKGVVNVEATAQDDGGLASAILFIDFRPMAELVADPAGATVRNRGTEPVGLSALNFDTASIGADAPHTFLVLATDKAGNQLIANGPGQGVALDFDNTPPMIDILDPILGSLGGSGSCVLRGQVNEPHGPAVVQVNTQVGVRPTAAGPGPFEIQGPFQAQNGTPANKITLQPDAAGQVSVTVLLDAGSNQPRTFELLVFFTTRDALGNTATLPAKRFIAMVDRSARMITCTPG